MVLLLVAHIIAAVAMMAAIGYAMRRQANCPHGTWYASTTPWGHEVHRCTECKAVRDEP